MPFEMPDITLPRLNRVQIGVITSVVFVIFLVGMILLAISFTTLSPNHVALDKNSVSNSVNLNKLYFEGRHCLGIGHSFVSYPMNWQIIDFSDDEEEGDVPLTAGSSDGQPITLEITVFFSLVWAEVPQLYSLLGQNYYNTLLGVAKSDLKNTAAKFATSEYYTARETIASTMKKNLESAFRERHAHVDRVLLRGVSFPTTIETQLVSKVVATQSIKTNEKLQTERQTIADTTLMQAEYNRTINEMLSAASAKGELIMESATANATSIMVKVQADSWKAYQTTLGLNNSQLIKVQWIRNIMRGSAGRKLLVGYDEITGIVSTSP